MRILCIGEPLIEFTAAPDAPSSFHRRPGGDSLNTAIYLARLLGPGTVGYLSRLGDDPHSVWLRQQMEEEGIDLARMATMSGGRAGLSFIATDAQGERSFAYWREATPFRGMFSADDGPDIAALGDAETIFLSAVTLAVLPSARRERLLRALERRRDAGARIVFDTNYRPVLWPDANEGRAAIERAARIASLLLPSLDDLQSCFGTAEPAAAMRQLMDLSDAEIVLTTGGGSVLHRAAQQGTFAVHSLPAPVAAIDTTGAGDSFNAAYLAAHHAGLSVQQAIAAAARLAAVVVCHPGAVIPRQLMPIILPKDTA